MKLTKSSVERLAGPARGYAIHWDDDLPGFGLRVTSTGAKAYVLERRIKGRNRRLTICRVEHMAPEAARNEARKLIGQIIQGADPIMEKQRRRAEGVTLAQALAAYIAGRQLKPRTQRDMQIVVGRYLKSWLNKPITSISPELVARKHREIGERSRAQANLAMKYLRAVFSFGLIEYTDSEGKPIITANPVTRLSQTMAWYRIERRRTVIKPHELKDWFSGVSKLPENARDYLLFSLFTGLRPGESATLKIADVDMKGRTFTITDTKNHKPHTLPLSDLTCELLERRISMAPGEYVFPGLHGKGHIKSVESAIRLVTADTGIEFCRNDLRRTFVTIAESLDIPAYALKRLLNHTMAGDVTAGYIVTDTERLRVPMQRIADFILKAAAMKKSAHVVELDHARA